MKKALITVRGMAVGMEKALRSASKEESKPNPEHPE
jgi:hypothetical protein